MDIRDQGSLAYGMPVTNISYNSTRQDMSGRTEYPTLIVYMCAFVNVETTSLSSYCLQKSGTPRSWATQDNEHLSTLNQAFEVSKNLNLPFPPAGYFIEQACHL